MRLEVYHRQYIAAEDFPEQKDVVIVLLQRRRRRRMRVEGVAEGAIAPSSAIVPRCLRTNRLAGASRDPKAVARVVGIPNAQHIAWLHEALELSIIWLRVSHDTRVATLPTLRSGHVAALDVSSACAVHVLDPSPKDNVLELCTAPCAKLAYIHDIQYAKLAITRTKELVNDDWVANTTTHNQDIRSFRATLPFSIRASLGTLTGVDNSERRLLVGNGLLRKLQVANYRLFLEDATKFTVNLTNDDLQQPRPFYIPGVARQLFQLATRNAISQSNGLYDRVLVDAECTHDGSVAHVRKRTARGWDDDFRGFLNPAAASSLTTDSTKDTSNNDSNRLQQEMESLQTLQRGLIRRGFELLRPGGCMVYSTCSFSWRQNEAIVTWLLETFPDTSRLDNVRNRHPTWPADTRFTDFIQQEKTNSDRWKVPYSDSTKDVNGSHGNLDHTLDTEDVQATSERYLSIETLVDVASQSLRLSPEISDTSGFYVARIRKIVSN